MRLLKENLQKEQQMMKFFVDQKMVDRTFEVGDWVFFQTPTIQTRDYCNEA